MSSPRRIVAGRIYLITRRCTQRQFLLRPEPQINNAFLYCLAFAATRTNTAVIAFLAEANHYHAVIQDRDGVLPIFLECFHKLLAKCGNAIRGRWENFWSNAQTSVVELVDSEDVFAKLIYTLSNPVKDRLVEKVHHWPGASSLAANLRGKVLDCKRPHHFFRRDGAMPKRLTLECVRPPGFETLTDQELRERLAAELVQIEDKVREELRRLGRRILGRKAVMAQRPTERPTSQEPRRRLDPRVAARNPAARAQALLSLKEFRALYRCARERWLAGETVFFPHGTWWLMRFAAVPCEAAPA